MTSPSNRHPQVRRGPGRKAKVAGIEEAQERWGTIRTRGRTRGIVALVVVLVVLVAIGVFAKSNAGLVVVALIVVAVIIGTIIVLVGKSRTGLSITPEWKPEVDRDAEDDFDAADDGGTADQPEQVASVDDADQEAVSDPVRRLDAQILGADLTKLGQVVSPKLAKSYAVGTLVLEGPEIVWEPGTASQAVGIENLSTAPDQVSVVEAAPLWGSWALVRVATVTGDEWCMRVPGSVDLSPAFAELGLTFQRSS